jgi:hypothetical protein
VSDDVTKPMRERLKELNRILPPLLVERDKLERALAFLDKRAINPLHRKRSVDGRWLSEFLNGPRRARDLRAIGGTAASVNIALYARQGRLRRVAHGVYEITDKGREWLRLVRPELFTDDNREETDL